uniref:Uncharacterized protein n=1 Tax=Haplochromis burtoni TaxID=8153 RepID=A0A3Q3CN61_HAPBU
QPLQRQNLTLTNQIIGRDTGGTGGRVCSVKGGVQIHGLHPPDDGFVGRLRHSDTPKAVQIRRLLRMQPTNASSFSPNLKDGSGVSFDDPHRLLQELLLSGNLIKEAVRRLQLSIIHSKMLKTEKNKY